VATTPTYGWDYQGLSDPPNGALLGENLALDAEATVSGIDTRLTTAESDINVIQAIGPYTARTILSGTQAAITFSSIPSNLRRLKLFWTARGDTGGFPDLRIRVNNDSGANYHFEYLQGNGAVPSSAPGTSGTSAQLGFIPGVTATPNSFGAGECTIVGWDSPHSIWLSWVATSGMNVPGTLQVVHATTGSYIVAGPYTRLDIFLGSGSFVSGSDFQLEGWYA